MKIDSPWHLAAVALLLKQVWWVQLVSIALVCIGFNAFARKSQWWEIGTWFFKDFARFASCLIYLLSWGQVPQHLVLEVDSHKVKLTAQQRKQGHKELWKVDQHACDGTRVWTSWSSWSTRPGDVCGILWGTTLIYFVSRTACPRKIHIFLRRSKDAYVILCSQILDISKAYRLSVDIRTFAPNMSLCTDKYVAELHEKMHKK